MTKAKPLDNRIQRASYLAVCARVNLDLFSFLSLRTNRTRFEHVLTEHWSLFEFMSAANEHQFLTRIVNLFARRKDTDNYPSLVDEAESTNAIDTLTCLAIRTQIQAAQGSYEVARTIRHKVVAHQDDTLTKPEIYKRVRPTLDMFVGLSNQSLAIGNALCAARGLVPQPLFPTPVQQLEGMLSKLQRHARTDDNVDAP